MNALKDKEMSMIEHFFDIDRHEQAYPHITSVLKEDPNDPEALFYLAYYYYYEDEYAEARNACQEALENGYDDEAEVYNFLGTILKEERNFQGAEECFIHAIELEPENAGYLADYGELMLLAGFEDKAYALLEEAKRLDYEDEDVHQALLKYYMVTSNNGEQIAAIQNIMETSNSEVRKLLSLGLYHLQREELKQARENFLQAYLLVPTNKDLLEVLREIDEASHALFAPHRLVEKLGGPAVVWLAFIISAIFFYKTNQNILFVIVGVYLLFAVYSWTIPIIYRKFLEGRD